MRQARQKRLALLRLEIRQEKEINRCDHHADEQIQVKRPAPGGAAVTERAADDGAEHGADTPDQASETEVLGPFDIVGRDR